MRNIDCRDYFEERLCVMLSEADRSLCSIYKLSDVEYTDISRGDMDPIKAFILCSHLQRFQVEITVWLLLYGRGQLLCGGWNKTPRKVACTWELSLDQTWRDLTLWSVSADYCLGYPSNMLVLRWWHHCRCTAKPNWQKHDIIPMFISFSCM